MSVVLEAISMMFLTISLFLPIVTLLSYDLVWFGIIMVIVVGLE